MFTARLLPSSHDNMAFRTFFKFWPRGHLMSRESDWSVWRRRAPRANENRCFLLFRRRLCSCSSVREEGARRRGCTVCTSLLFVAKTSEYLYWLLGNLLLKLCVNAPLTVREGGTLSRRFLEFVQLSREESRLCFYSREKRINRKKSK